METNENKQVVTPDKKEKRDNIRKRVVALERYNYTQKDFSTTDMIAKIKKIIESEVNK